MQEPNDKQIQPEILAALRAANPPTPKPDESTRGMATHEHWRVLMDWIEWLQREAPRRTPKQMRAAMAYADASFAKASP